MTHFKCSIILLLLMVANSGWAKTPAARPYFCGRVQSLIYEQVAGEAIGAEVVVASKFEQRFVHVQDAGLTKALLQDVMNAANEPIEQLDAPYFFKAIARVANYVRFHICIIGLTIEKKSYQGVVIEAGYIDENSQVEITTL